MGFLLEVDMTTVLNRWLKASPLSSLAIAQELPVRRRFVDIVLGQLPSVGYDYVKSNCILSNLAGLHHTHLHILAILRTRGRTSIHYLKRKLGRNPQEIRATWLGPLLEMGLVLRVSKYAYIISPELAQIEPVLIAIELKRFKWKHAIEQARYNLCFAQKSYIAVDAQAVPIEEVIHHCKTGGIGLLAVYDTNVQLILNPPLQRRKTIESEYQRLRLIKELMTGGPKWRLLQNESI